MIFTQSIYCQLGTLTVGATLTALILAVGHWFPARPTMVLTWRYIYGVSSIIFGFGFWRLLNGDWITLLGLIIISIIGGAVVILAYKYDRLHADSGRAAMAQAADDELMRG